jgi:hypothetical protein
MIFLLQSQEKKVCSMFYGDFKLRPNFVFRRDQTFSTQTNKIYLVLAKQ